MTSICIMLDDVLITGQNDNEHMQNLEEVFQRFQKYGLRLKKEKCTSCSLQLSTVAYV